MILQKRLKNTLDLQTQLSLNILRIMNDLFMIFNLQKLFLALHLKTCFSKHIIINTVTAMNLDQS